MPLTPYAEALALSKEDKQKKLIPSRVKSEKAKMELEVYKLEESLASLDADLDALCQGSGSANSLDIAAIGSKLDAIDLATRRLNQYKDIVSKLFPAVAE